MTLPDGYAARPATRADAQAITQMFAEQETRLNGEAESTVEDLFDDWSTPGFDIERDTWVIGRGAEVVGYAGIVKHIPPDVYAAYGGVHPEHAGRGLGTFLFEAVERRALEKGGGRSAIRQWVDARDARALALLKSRGYEFVRRFWRMDASLDGVVTGPASVDGVTIRGFEKGRDERRTHEVFEEAFAEHWGFTPRTYEEAAATRWEADWFKTDFSLVAEADGDIVAASINSRRLDDGYIDDLAVLPAWRGKGIAEALLRTSFQMFKDAGLHRVALNVDSDNSTGATRLYERVGMRPATSYDVYQRYLEA